LIQPESGWQQPVRRSPNPPSIPGRRRGPIIVVAVLVAIVVLVGSAAAAFGLAHFLGPASAPRDCGRPRVSVGCIAGLEVTDIVTSLRAQGFSCRRGSGQSQNCALTIGATSYSVLVDTPNGRRTHELAAYVRGPDRASRADHERIFLSWVAVLPFPADQDTATATKAWLVRQLGRQAHEKATINGYRYDFNAINVDDVHLTINGGMA
jgi:hypothetical protein